MKTDTKTLKLKVSEALSKDVGRAYARMGPEDLARLGVEVGDIVEVAGKTKAVCKAMPAYKEMRGQSQIQLDGLTRENAGVGLDELVHPYDGVNVIVHQLGFAITGILAHQVGTGILVIAMDKDHGPASLPGNVERQG